MTYSIASESLGGGVCFQACLLVCKGLDDTKVMMLAAITIIINKSSLKSLSDVT